MKRPVLILGGASDVGLAVARRFAQDGRPIQLAARRPDELEAERANIALHAQVKVTTHHYNALDLEAAEAFFDELPALPEIIVCVVGLLGDQRRAERNPEHAKLICDTNFLGPAVALEVAVARMVKFGQKGVIVGVSSVAGDRGRAKNYWYGASKAAFSTFLSGLRQRCDGADIDVHTIKPGFIKTKMLDERTPALLTSSPDRVAKYIINASRSTPRASVIWPWSLIMFIIKLMPDKIFKPLNI